MLKFLVFILFLSICSKCKGSPATSTTHRIRRGTDNNIGCGKLAPESGQLLVNFDGKEAKRGAYPWHVALYRNENNTYICGGTIINEKMIITAANCITTYTRSDAILKPANEYYVQAGKLFSKWDADEDKNFVQKRTISKIVKTNNYIGETNHFAGDLAIMVVNEPFEITNFVRPACIDWNLEYVEEQLKSGVLGHVVGWGTKRILFEGPSLFLKQYKFPFIEYKQCVSKVPQNLVQYITMDKYCAGLTNGTGLCIGDSGNGMIFSKEQSGAKKYYIQGVVSVSFSKSYSTCDENQPAVYTKVSAHIKWLKETVEANKTK